MKLLKLALISLVIFAVLVLCLSLIFPSHIRVSRAINIEAPQDSVLPLLKDLRHWQAWNEFTLAPSATPVSYTDSSINAEHFHVSKLSEMQDTMRVAWLQQNGRVTTAAFTWYPGEHVIVVQWYFDIHLRWYPWEKFSSLLVENQLGQPMERSLAQLKKLAERKP